MPHLSGMPRLYGTSRLYIPGESSLPGYNHKPGYHALQLFTRAGTCTPGSGCPAHHRPRAGTLPVLPGTP